MINFHREKIRRPLGYLNLKQNCFVLVSFNVEVIVKLFFLDNAQEQCNMSLKGQSFI